MSETQSLTADDPSEFVLPGEQVQDGLRADDRTVLVTDRRFLDVTEGVTPEGREFEHVQSTLFSDVSRVEVDARGRTTETNLLVLLAGIAAALLGLGLLFAGMDADSQGGELVLLGLLALGAGIWLLLNAQEESPGGISLEFYYPGDQAFVTEEYVLPETRSDFAHQVVRAVGQTHGP